MNLENYFPILLFIAVGVAVGVVPMVLGKVLGPNRPDSQKLSPYECGFEAFEDARMKFDVRYYLVAILFILFDLETALLFPWAAVAPPIAGGPVNYTDEQFAAFLQTGMRPDGSHPRPPMPAFRFNEEDSRAVVAYIKTLPRADSAPHN